MSVELLTEQLARTGQKERWFTRNPTDPAPSNYKDARYGFGETAGAALADWRAKYGR